MGHFYFIRHGQTVWNVREQNLILNNLQIMCTVFKGFTGCTFYCNML